jgi:hypothetical protein
VIRSFRDYFAPAIFAAALNVPVAEVPAVVYLAVDVPGAVLSCVGLVLVSRIESNAKAIRFLLFGQIAALVLLLLATVLFSLGWLPGLVWQVHACIHQPTPVGLRSDYIY